MVVLVVLVTRLYERGALNRIRVSYHKHFSLRPVTVTTSVEKSKLAYRLIGFKIVNQ